MQRIFSFTYVRSTNGRYIVNLPIKPGADLTKLADSKQNALLSLKHVQWRLLLDPVMDKLYTDFIEDIINRATWS